MRARLVVIAAALVVGIGGFLLVEAQRELKPVGSEQEVHLADLEPQWDKKNFRRSAQSIARADLLACRNKDARLTQGRDADPKEMARALNGVWLNQNRRTVHGLPVETDTAFYIQMDGTTGMGLLIDRNNMGQGTLARPYQERGMLSTRRTARPLSMKQVNCTWEFVDEYVKVSDQIDIQALAATTPIRPKRGMSLLDAWNQLVEAGYFETFDMPLSNNPAGPHLNLRATLGDKSRVAVLPDGTLVEETQIAAGLAPGAEYELPMLTGGFFRITLRPVEGGGRPYKAVLMRWDAEYRGAGIGLPPGEASYGIEQGEFVMEGNAFVSARSMYEQPVEPVEPADPVSPTGAEVPGDFDMTVFAAVGDQAWLTSECADKNAMDVSSTLRAEQLTLPDGTTREVFISPQFYFERFVIGAPGADRLSRARVMPSASAEGAKR